MPPPKPRDHAPIHLWHPTIRDTPITTISQLHTILETEYPGLHRNPNYAQLLQDAETHLRLIHHLKDQNHLQRGDRKRIGHELGLTRQKFTAWAQHARKPRLYYELDRMLSKTQANKRISQLHKENNGIFSTDDVIARLKTYYPAQELTTSKLHHKRLTHCTQYFHALNLLKDGGAYLDAACTLRVHHSQIMRWLDGQRPDYIELTRRIPDEIIPSEIKWLPLKMEGNFHPVHFIKVPLKIDSWEIILGVLAQIEPLKNESMVEWEILFGNISQGEAFSYVLGIMVSDAHKPKPGFTSTSIDLRLSKKYPWSERVGEAVCYYLGKIGIFAKKGEDRDSSSGKKTCHSWESEKSPLLTWMQKICLGLETHERTTYHSLRANWILVIPPKVRKRFLQGLNDGDGWASIKDQVLGNACQPNIQFYQDLLKTWGIESRHDTLRVKISRQGSIIRATTIPFFFHAVDRQKEAEKLAEMIRVRREENPQFIPKKVIERAFQLYLEGKSHGKIAEIIFDEYGVSYDPRRIEYILRKDRDPMD